MKISRLIWDNWNILHIARHGVTREDIEQVCQREFAVRDGKKERFLVIGTNNSEKFIAIVVDPESEEGVYYPVTARIANKKERLIYQQEKGKHEQKEN